MRKVFPARVFLVLAWLFGTIQCQAQTIPADIKKTVTFIFLANENGQLRQDPQGHPVADGTGFFVGVKNENGDRFYCYLVTAKHVLRDDQGVDLRRVFVRLNTKDGGYQFVPVDLEQGGHRNVYVNTDPSVDIAVVPALPSSEIFDFKFIPDNLISTKKIFNEYNVSEGTSTFFIGLFTTYYGEHRNNPIFRFGHVAMFPDDKIDWADYIGKPPQKADLYLIEAQSYGGNSGSPVFFYLGSDRSKNGDLVMGPPLIMLAGVMRGRFNETSPVVVWAQSPTSVSGVTLPNLGIAAVTPSYALHDILFSEELKKMRVEHPIIPPPAQPATESK